MRRGTTGRYEITGFGGEQVRAFIPHALPPSPPYCYSFTDEELDFIINYDVKYRMGKDAGEEAD